MTSEFPSTPTLVHRAGHTLGQFAVIFVYLFVCFGAIVLHKAAVLRAVGVSFAPWGFAAVKAFILGKFMLIGHEIHLGERFTGRPLIYPTIYRSGVFLLFLLMLSAIEEMVSGALRGQTTAETAAALFGSRLYEVLSATLIMFLALLPYFAIRQLADALGKDRLARLFFVDGRRLDGGEPSPGDRRKPPHAAAGEDDAR